MNFEKIISIKEQKPKRFEEMKRSFKQVYKKNGTGHYTAFIQIDADVNSELDKLIAYFIGYGVCDLTSKNTFGKALKQCERKESYINSLIKRNQLSVINTIRMLRGVLKSKDCVINAKKLFWDIKTWDNNVKIKWVRDYLHIDEVNTSSEERA
jgi:hypothetical protein